MTSAPSLTWVIGRGGLLGQSVENAMGASMDHTGGSGLWRPAEPIPWIERTAGAPELAAQAEQFLRAAGDRPWSVAWCAGAGVMGTSTRTLDLELVALRKTLTALAADPHDRSQLW